MNHPDLTTACPSRRGFAVVLASVVLCVVMALAVSLTELTVGNMILGKARSADVNLTVTSESIANLGFNYLQNVSDLTTQLASSRVAGVTPVDITTVALAGAPTHLGQATLNGLSPTGNQCCVTWKFLGAMTVPIDGTMGLQNFYQITTTVGYGGPAVYYNSDGTINAVPDMTHYRRRRVEAVFTEYPNSAYRQAMFAMNGYQFMGSATTDSWNSEEGAHAYGTVASGSHGDLSSNGTITVQHIVNVDGTVSSQINMPVPPLTYNPPASAIDLPGPIGTFTQTVTGNPGGNPMVSGSYRCSKIDIATNNSIAIAAGAHVDIYLDGPLLITKDWEIPATAVVRIFQNDYLPSLGVTRLNGNITVGCPQNPRSFQLYSLYSGTLDGSDGSGNGWDIQMNGTAELGAVIMAPMATFDLNGTFEYFGSLVCNAYKDSTGTGKVNGNFKFHYDESLSNLEWPFPPTLVVVGWRSSNLGLAEWKSPGVRWDAP